MADEIDLTAGEENPLLSEHWIDKTNSVFGVNLDLSPPEMRYQLLQGRMFTLQYFPDGAIARGEIDPVHVGFPINDGEGWYDGEGKFLGDEPTLPEWITSNIQEG